MALVKCEECGKDISDKAIACIHCGNPIEQNNNFDSTLSQNIVEDIKCDVEIVGNERLSNMSNIVMFTLIISVLFSMFKGIIFILFIPVLIYLSNLKSKKDNKARKIYFYFQKKFPILKEVKPSYANLGLAYGNDSNHEQAMFDIYMQAYRKNADAIVLQSNTTSTHVSGGYQKGLFPSGVSSSTSHHLMATLVKYK